jgi:hypothetical protein
MQEDSTKLNTVRHLRKEFNILRILRISDGMKAKKRAKTASYHSQRDFFSSCSIIKIVAHSLEC